MGTFLSFPLAFDKQQARKAAMIALPTTIRIATRASQLALAQANMVKNALISAHSELSDETVVILPMTTSGDKNLEKDIKQWGYKGLFTKEIEDALLQNEADIAVHSMKDMPSELPDGLKIAALLPREQADDAFLSKRFNSFDDLPEGATIGTSSTRRAAIAKHLRPDLEIAPFRGNVNTRLQKLENGEVDATFLAVAGLKRIGLEQHITQIMPLTQMLPAIAQGAIGVECRSDDTHLKSLLESIHDSNTEITVSAERSLLKTLDGDCHTPLSGYAEIADGQLHLKAMLFKPDGSDAFTAERTAALTEAIELGRLVGEEIKTFKS
ncbi:MAG: hydroxymethylbilane synthase [Rickettsiales bacterium]|nr:hydroxymethylbilane synthase [Rickettsiales bacterium]